LFFCPVVLSAQTGEKESGKSIINYVFTAGRHGHQQIYIVDEHLIVQRLTDYKDEHNFFRISVSLDKKKLAFQVVMLNQRFLKIIDINSFSEMKHIELLHNVVIHEVSWSADAKYIAVVCGSKLPYQLLIIDTSSYKISTLTHFDKYSPRLTWSIQGHKLLFVKDGMVMFTEPSSALFRQLNIDNRFPVWDENGDGIIVFSKDIYHISLDGTITILYANVMDQMTPPSDCRGPFLYPGIYLGVKYSLDRKKCILCTDISPPEVSSVYLRIFFINIEKKYTMSLSDVFKVEGSKNLFGTTAYRSCDFSPDSMKFVCDSNGGINILDIESGNTLFIAEEDYIFWMPQFSADGRFVFFKGNKKGKPDTEFTYYVTAGGGEIKRLDY